jgi:hypothetical protein
VVFVPEQDTSRSHWEKPSIHRAGDWCKGCQRGRQTASDAVSAIIQIKEEDGMGVMTSRFSEFFS